MNLVLLNPADFIDRNIVLLQGRRFDHLKRVNRIKIGDTLICGQVNGNMGTGIVQAVSDRDCKIAVLLDTPPPAPLPVTLIMALPRPKFTRRIVQAVASLGVKEIYLINSWRVEKSFWQSPLVSPESLDHQLMLGLEQSRDTLLPHIYYRKYFKPFVEDELPAISKNSERITAHPKTDRICPIGVDGPVTLVVGPEGGFIDMEIQTLEQIGFHSYHVGSRILKVETAIPYLISRVSSI